MDDPDIPITYRIVPVRSGVQERTGSVDHHGCHRERDAPAVVLGLHEELHLVQIPEREAHLFPLGIYHIISRILSFFSSFFSLKVFWRSGELPASKD